MLHAKGGQLAIDDTTMEYICFGTGAKNLIMIPGLGDGLTSVKGKAIPFALLYRQYAKEYTIYVFSRKNKLMEGDNTRTTGSQGIGSIVSGAIEEGVFTATEATVKYVQFSVLVKSDVNCTVDV
ncbi:MAG: hypothetical protein IJO65_11240, partial [Lachnospiraceae bacterium]|nr:hypothetical protein [Lachnospiraceae bacterium]